MRMWKQYQERYRAFWSRNPALFLGLSLLLGNSIAFHFYPCLVVAFLVLLLTAKSRRSFILSIVCFSAAFFNASYRYPKVTLSEEKLAGVGVFHIEEVKHSSSPFQKSLLYKGTLKTFETGEGITFNNLPCQIYLPLFGKRPSANIDYKIQGALCQKGDHAFVLKPGKNIPWAPLLPSFNLAEWRFCAKQAVARYLKKHITDPHARTLFIALTTGEIDERILSMEFGKVGLQHLLAISGFHFALAALFLGLVLRLLLPGKWSIFLLIAALSCYYLFLGGAPSIQRAYIAIVLFAIGQFFSLKISGLNALGAGLIAEMLLSPFSVTLLSFQLSFLCTLAILMFYPIVNQLLAFIFPERTYSEVKEMSLLDKHGALLSRLLRQMLSLNLSVHLISLPVLLYLFHKFPLLSLSYNLFFPPCITLSMLLFFVALFLAPIPPLSHMIHALNNAWTSAILNLTTNPPAFLDSCIRTKALSFSWVIVFLIGAFFLGIFFHEKQRKEIQS